MGTFLFYATIWTVSCFVFHYSLMFAQWMWPEYFEILRLKEQLKVMLIQLIAARLAIEEHRAAIVARQLMPTELPKSNDSGAVNVT